MPVIEGATMVDNFIPSSQRMPDGTVEHSVYNGGAIEATAPVLNGRMSRRNWAGYRRPYFDKYDRPSVTVNKGRWTVEKGVRRPVLEQVLVRDLLYNGFMLPVYNATTLRKEEWLELDKRVLRAARWKLKAWADLAGANTFGGFNGMNKMILEHETMSDPGEAIVDMDGLTPGRTDAPKYQLEGTPLPITHSDFWTSARFLGISRNSDTPFDSTMGEAAGRRIAEALEKTTIGNQTGPTYGGNSTMVGGYGRTSSVYGYLNFPSRLTKTGLYRPTGLGASGTGWKPGDTISDVLGILDTLALSKFTGPFIVYHSNDWDRYMDNDYILTGGNVATQTLRNRLRQMDRISDVKRLDFLFASTPAATTGPGGEHLTATYPFTMIFVQMTPDVAEGINGMDITTVQWEAQGGMRLNFKVMCIQVPRLRADIYGNCGILQATFNT